MGFSPEYVLVGYVNKNTTAKIVTFELNVVICVILNSVWFYKTVCVRRCIECVECYHKLHFDTIVLSIDFILTVYSMSFFRKQI